MTTQEGNKLIADFEGLETKDFDLYLDGVKQGVCLHYRFGGIWVKCTYHLSWEEIMPVVLKIMREDFGFNEGFKLAVLSNNVTSCELGTFDTDVPVISQQEDNPITAVWKAVVTYLKNNHAKQDTK